MAEHVAMRLLKREVPATPGTAYAKITIHTEDKPDGEYHGVYILLEDIDKAALRRRFGNDDGPADQDQQGRLRGRGRVRRRPAQRGQGGLRRLVPARPAAEHG